MGRLKVLYTIPNFDTAGSGKALLHVAKGLDKERFEVHILCAHDRGDFFKTVEESGFTIHVFPYTVPMKPYWRGLQGCYAISKRLRAIGADLIHSFHYAADYSEALAAKMAGIPWIYTKKNMNWGGASKNAWKLRTFLASGIVVQNTDMQQYFFKGIPHVSLIPRGVDVTQFYPKDGCEDLMKEWGIAPSDRIVMCVANLVPVKGIEVLLSAFKVAQDLHPAWKLMVVGDADHPYGTSMKALKTALGLDSRVLFCGKQSRIVDYLSLAEVFVLPTLNEGRKEGSPVALLEAMACGKTVLASNISGIKDQLAPFQEQLVAAGAVVDWAKALNGIFSNSSTINFERGMELRAYVLKNYPLEKEVERCEIFYETIVGSTN